MTIPKKSDEVVQRILYTLEKTRNIVLKKISAADAPHIYAEVERQVENEFRNIENALEIVNNVMPNLILYEEKLFRQFTDLEHEIDEYCCSEDDQRSGKAIQELQEITKKIVSLQTLIPSLIGQSHDPATKSNNEAIKLQEIQYRTTQYDWSKLRIDDRLLKSREMRYLMASLEHLASPQSKMCALYYTIFPENWQISKRQMTYWWIAESWAVSKDKKSAAQVADDIFQEHINQGLINPVHGNKSWRSTHYFKIHPWIHRKLVSIAKEAELFNFGPDRMPLNGHCRSFLYSEDNDPHQGNNLSMNGNQEEALLSVFNISRKYLNLNKNQVARWRKVVTLQLGRWRCSPEHHIEVESEEFLKGLKNMKFLKYLGLRGISRITTLPSSIKTLVSLEILDLRSCQNLEKLPDLSPLINLTHLDVSECYLVENMPKNIGKLSKLQVLKGFVIGKKRSSSKISDLVHLRHLRKLSIYIGSKATVAEREFELLKDMESLRILAITWPSISSTTEDDNPEAVPSGDGEVLPNSEPGSASNDQEVASTSEQKSELNGDVISFTAEQTSAIDGVKKSEIGSAISFMSLPEKLQKLDLRCYPQTDLPLWLDPGKLEELEKLYIRGGKLEKITQRGKVWNIKILRFKYLNNLKVNEDELRKLFPFAHHLENIVFGGDEVGALA